MAKQVTFSTNPRTREADQADLDAFVHCNRSESPTSKLKRRMKRLTFDIPADLHSRMKLECVREGRDMADVLREMIAKRWPP